MLGLLNRHSFAAICIAVFLEELGIPVPIPTDLLIIFAGVAAGHAWPRLVMAYVAISFASALGSSILYAIIRPGRLLRYRCCWNPTIPYTVRYITDTLCGVSPLPDWAPRCYNEFKTGGVMDHNRFDDLAEPWLRRLVAR